MVFQAGILEINTLSQSHIETLKKKAMAPWHLLGGSSQWM